MFLVIVIFYQYVFLIYNAIEKKSYILVSVKPQIIMSGADLPILLALFIVCLATCYYLNYPDKYYLYLKHSLSLHFDKIVQVTQVV